MLPEDVRFKMGTRIKEIRQHEGYSQNDFSESLDISVNFLSEIENGRKGISCETLYNLCNKHNVSSDYILFGPSPEKKPTEMIIAISNNLTVSELDICIAYFEALKKMKSV